MTSAKMGDSGKRLGRGKIENFRELSKIPCFSMRRKRRRDHDCEEGVQIPTFKREARILRSES